MTKILSLGSLMIAAAAQASVVEVVPAPLMECTPEAGQTRNYSVTMSLANDSDVVLNIVKTDVSGTMKEWSQRLGSASLQSRFEKMPDGQDLEIPLLKIDIGNNDNLTIELAGTNVGPWLGVLKMGADEGVRLICRELVPAQK